MRLLVTITVIICLTETHIHPCHKTVTSLAPRWRMVTGATSEHCPIDFCDLGQSFHLTSGRSWEVPGGQENFSPGVSLSQNSVGPGSIHYFPWATVQPHCRTKEFAMFYRLGFSSWRCCSLWGSRVSVAGWAVSPWAQILITLLPHCFSPRTLMVSLALTIKHMAHILY